MQDFRLYLKQDYMTRVGKNPHYSLRAFAMKLGINHATLSSMLSGKRKITKAAILKMSRSLGLSPEEIKKFTEPGHGSPEKSNYTTLHNDAFAAISEWYYDAILELSLIEDIDFSPFSISRFLKIPVLQAQIALETLERLNLLQKNALGRYVAVHVNSTNIIDPDLTSVAQKNHQRALLEKSIEAIDLVDRKYRDHTSSTVAIESQDLPQVKELIQKFRRDLNKFVQRKKVTPDEVYQLQVSFFPLSQINKELGR